MVRRRVRAMLARSVLIPVAISRAVFGHKNTNSPMSFLRRGPEHCSFGRLWEHAAANESCGKLWKSVDISFEAIAAAHLFVGGASASAPIECSPKYAAMSRASCQENPVPGIRVLGSKPRGSRIQRTWPEMLSSSRVTHTHGSSR